MENCMEIPQETKSRTTTWSKIPTPGHISQQSFTEKDNMCLYVHWSTIHNSQDMKTTCIQWQLHWMKKMWYIYTMGYYSAIQRKKIMLFEATWMELETFFLIKRKINAIWYHLYLKSYIWHIWYHLYLESNIWHNSGSEPHLRPSPQLTARSLTHWGRPGIKPASSWILVRFITCRATMGTAWLEVLGLQKSDKLKFKTLVNAGCLIIFNRAIATWRKSGSAYIISFRILTSVHSPRPELSFHS